MKRALIELAVILAIMLAAGTVYTMSIKGNSRKHIAWVNPMLGKGLSTLPKRKAEPGPARQSAGTTEIAWDGAGTRPVETGVGPVGEPRSADPPGPVKPPPQLPEAEGFRFADHDEVVQLYLDGETFIDARRSDQYEKGHITGAISIPHWEADAAARITRFRQEHPVEAPIVLYCERAQDCEDSQLLAGQLRQAGFLNLVVYTGGFPEWEERHPKDSPRVTRGSQAGAR